MEKCVFDRDTLFSFVIFSDSNFTQHLKLSDFTSEQLKQMPEFEQYLLEWYYYSNQLPVFNFANNDYRSRHDIEEVIVILSIEDLIPGGIKAITWPFDFDTIMVNQIMYTFHR